MVYKICFSSPAVSSAQRIPGITEIVWQCELYALKWDSELQELYCQDCENNTIMKVVAVHEGNSRYEHEAIYAE